MREDRTRKGVESGYWMVKIEQGRRQVAMKGYRQPLKQTIRDEDEKWEVT